MIVEVREGESFVNQAQIPGARMRFLYIGSSPRRGELVTAIHCATVVRVALLAE